MHIYFILLSLYDTHPEYWASQVVLMVRNLPANPGNPGDMGSITSLGTSPEGGHGNSIIYAWRIPMDREVWWAMVLRIAVSHD